MSKQWKGLKRAIKIIELWSLVCLEEFERVIILFCKKSGRRFIWVLEAESCFKEKVK